MELKSLGTFNHIGRPIDAIRFEVINGTQIRYQSVPADGLAMPVQSIVKVNVDPHPEYFEALDKLVPFAVKVLDLGPAWLVGSSIGSLKLDWTYNNNTEKYTYKITEISIARYSDVSEIVIPRIIKFGGITIDDIPWEVRDAIEGIIDEAWLYCIGKKTAQLNLFDVAPKSIQDELDDYLGRAGELPSVEGFQDWLPEQDEQEEPIVLKKATRSKSKKLILMFHDRGSPH